MTGSGFWTEGPEEHRHAYEQRLAELQGRLENCLAADFDQLQRDIAEAKKQLSESKNGRICW